eukprot:TRINITY_DN1136_c0_g1_i1.p1 TRINITY_DN1136_c0_g1~~TRINITY_DN1136_c0_g1_i1.p1  ORF type:complete len:284 (-),score=77.48 TRINITY_DN1136_c0_g1_i1:190-1041(-)
MNADPVVMKHKDLGDAEFSKGEMSAALTHYSNAIQIDQNNMECPLARAAVYLRSKKYEDCITDCKTVVELALLNPPDSYIDELLAKAYARMASAYLAQEKFNLAVRCCKSAYQTFPTDEFKRMLEQLEIINDKIAKLQAMNEPPAKKDKEKKKGQNDFNSSIDAANYCVQAKEMYKNEDYAEAIALYTKALSVDVTQKRAVTYINRAACYQKEKQYQLALNDAEKAIELDPEMPQGFFRKGCALEGLKRKQEAYDTYKKGLQLNPEHVQLNKRCEILKKQLGL